MVGGAVGGTLIALIVAGILAVLYLRRKRAKVHAGRVRPGAYAPSELDPDDPNYDPNAKKPPWPPPRYDGPFTRTMRMTGLKGPDI